MFRAIRLTILLGLLVFVATGAFLARARTTDWDAALWVAIHPINAAGSSVSTQYIDTLSNETFGPIEEFIAREAARYQVRVSEPVRVELYDEVGEMPPQLDGSSNALNRALWSLRLRFWAWRMASDGDRPPPDIRMFVLFHDPASTSVVP
ncbi:MAG: hypothetical protein ACRETX_17780, partial [Steroidobacteraceae bacterium]